MSEQAPTGWRMSGQLVAAVIAIATVLVGWGYTFSGLQRDTDRNSSAVESLTIGLEKNDSATAQLELRVKQVERIADDAIKLRRELDATLGRMQADIAVIKAMLEKKGAPP
jgi:Tfp pilus assembly protein PilO